MIKDSYMCALALCMDLIGGKWKIIILWYLYHGPLRFSAIQRILGGITQKMLTQQLRELEETGLVHREVYPVVPPKVEYSLTKEALQLFPALEAMRAWGRGYADARGIRRNPPELPEPKEGKPHFHSSFEETTPAGG